MNWKKAVKEAKSHVENFKRAMKKPPRAGKKLLKKLEESYRRLQASIEGF